MSFKNEYRYTDNNMIKQYCYSCWTVLLLLLLLLCAKQVTAQPTNYTTATISFESSGVALAGTIFKPAHSYAAVVVVHGSGQEKRMTRFASLLADNGITVLTYDKRGVGESGGVYAGPEVGTNNIDAANLSLLATDASNAATTLLAHLPADHGPVGLMGFSQAGWVIPIAAKKNPAVNCMVIFSGPVATTREQLRFQFFTQGNADFWQTHTEAEAREHIRSDADRYEFTDTSAGDTLATLSIPGLWLFGARDVQAPVGLSIEHLDALKAQGKPYQYRLFPALGHNTAFSKSGEPVDAAIQWLKSIALEGKK